MYFIIAGNPVRSMNGGTNYSALRVAAKCQTMDEVKEKIDEIYDRAAGLVLVIDEHGNVPDETE